MSKTDKKLTAMEKEIGRVYKRHPALLKAKKEYSNYMKDVEKHVSGSYKAYINETDIKHKEELKEAYIGELERLTLKSKTYNSIVSRLIDALTQANQDALNIVNDKMLSIYVESYNEVAGECKKAGIKIE